MWGLFKKKTRQQDDELRKMAEQLLGPSALVTALAETSARLCRWGESRPDILPSPSPRRGKCH